MHLWSIYEAESGWFPPTAHHLQLKHAIVQTSEKTSKQNQSKYAKAMQRVAQTLLSLTCHVIVSETKDGGRRLKAEWLVF